MYRIGGRLFPMNLPSESRFSAKFTAHWIFLLSCLCPGLAVADQSLDAASLRLDALKAEIRSDYPTVRHRSIDEVRHADAPLLLVDVRSAKEYAISRLPGAVHLDDRQALLAYARSHPETELVLYCSVGVRSSRAVQWLQAQGVAHARNLEGSIFEWHNRGLPMENDRGATDEVHGYNLFWRSRYLSEG
jgi:rhodanese-related sulfurtransferase